MQKRYNSNALPMEFRLFCFNRRHNAYEHNYIIYVENIYCTYQSCGLMQKEM